MKLILPGVALSLLAASCPIPIPEPSPQEPYDCDAQPAQDGLVRVKGAIKDRYIVVLNPPPAAERSIASVRSFAGRFVGISEVKVYTGAAVYGFAATIDKAALAQLLASKDSRGASSVRYIQEDGTKSVKPIKASAGLPWGLDRVDQRDLPLDKTFEPGGDGATIHMISIDTGVDCSHPDFGGRCGEGHSAIGGTPDDTHGHGTHTMGTMAGKTFGIARAAVLHSCRFLDAQGSGSDSGAVECIDWATKLCTEKGWKCIANNSWGGPPAPAVDEAMCRSIEAGLLQVAAAGNDNLGACGYSPSRVKQILTLGASDNRDDMASFSNEGVCVDVHGPGVDIESAAPGGGSTPMSGTSMACPHGAGVAALWWARHPASGPEGVAALVVSNATPDKINTTVGTTRSVLYAREQ